MGQREALERLKQKIGKRVELDEMYLFGSRARGTFTEDSDFDIAFVSEDFEGMKRMERYELLIDDVRQVLGDRPVDLACYTPEEFERGSDSFLPSVIQEEGISL